CAYLTLRLVEGRRLERLIAAAPGIRCDLVWLGFARSLARHDQNASPPSFKEFLQSEDRRVIVECLSSDLARRWALSALWDESDVLEAEHAVSIGTAERALLQGYLDALERADPLDLATFLVDAA